MDRDSIHQLFEATLMEAAANAEKRFKIEVPHKFKIRLAPYGTKHGSKLYDVATAAEAFLRESDMYPLYIDVGIEAVSINRVFAIPSQETVPFSQTWNYADGKGPFKQQINEELVIVPDYSR